MDGDERTSFFHGDEFKREAVARVESMAGTIKSAKSSPAAPVEMWGVLRALGEFWPHRRGFAGLIRATYVALHTRPLEQIAGAGEFIAAISSRNPRISVY